MKKLIVGVLLLVATVIWPGVMLGIGLVLLVLASTYFIGWLAHEDTTIDEAHNSEPVWLWKVDEENNENGEWN